MSANFHNMPSAQIVDEYGALNLQSKAIEARLKDLKAELIRREVSSESGSKFSLTVSEQISIRLDTKKLKESLGEEICKEFETASISTVVRVKNLLPEIRVMEAA